MASIIPVMGDDNLTQYFFKCFNHKNNLLNFKI